MDFLTLLVKLGTLVFFAYLISSRSRITVRGIVIYLLVMSGITNLAFGFGRSALAMAIGAALLVAAAVVSGQLVLFRNPTWITSPAVVTAVETVTYRDVIRWRIRFAYFDREGVAQESADEVVTGAWKPGDSCLAVYQPDQPDLATLKPLST